MDFGWGVGLVTGRQQQFTHNTQVHWYRKTHSRKITINQKAKKKNLQYYQKKKKN